MASFVWGGNTGEKLTPKEVERQRLAAALMARDAGMTTPVASPWAGVNRALQGYLSGRDKRNAGAAETAGMAGADAYVRDNPVLSGLLGGGPSDIGISTAGAPAGSPAPVASQYPIGQDSIKGVGSVDPASGLNMGEEQPSGNFVVDGLVRRGMPQHIAEGFAMNFQDESGMNPTAVGDGGNAYGLAQWNGPRKAALVNYARAKGQDVSDPNTQLDYLMEELNGSQSGAWSKISSATDANQAGAAVLNHFERPAEQHRARREAAYLGGGGMSASGQPIPITGGGSNVVGALASAMSDPWVAEKYGPVLQAMMTQQMGRGDMQFQQQLAQSDPMYQAQLAQLTAKTAPKPIEVGGVLLDPNTFQPIFDSRQQDQFTLGAGDVRYGPNGAVIATGSPAVTAQPLTDPVERAKWGIPATDTRPYAIEAGKRPELIGGGGVSVTVGGAPEMGKLSTDYAYLTDQAGKPIIDPFTNLPKAAPVPGSPAAIEAEKLGQKTVMADNQTAATGDIVSTDIDRAIKLIDKPGVLPTTGFGAGMASRVGGTTANDLKNLLDTVKANTAFDTLSQMRAASPTGGALGAVSERELTLLSAAKGALDQSQTPQQLKDNLIRLQNITLDIIHGPGAGPARKKTSYDSPPAQSATPAGIDPADWQFMTPEEKALFQ